MMSKEKQVGEMAKVMCGYYGTEKCYDCRYYCACHIKQEANRLYNAGYRKQEEGEWEWFEVWSPSTPGHPGKCEDCGWQCSRCKVELKDMVGGYWCDVSTMPELPFCPNCGAKMKGV